MSKYIVEAYFAILKRLNNRYKLDLIEKLSRSIKKSPSTERDIRYFEGAWDSEESAEEMIQVIKSSDAPGRNIETF